MKKNYDIKYVICVEDNKEISIYTIPPEQTSTCWQSNPDVYFGFDIKKPYVYSFHPFKTITEDHNALINAQLYDTYRIAHNEMDSVRQYLVRRLPKGFRPKFFVKKVRVTYKEK